jgi:hypothetical protein
MAQLEGKVNHFGETDVSNLYKNQQITNHLDFVSLSFNKINVSTLGSKVETAGVFSRPEKVRKTK